MASTRPTPTASADRPSCGPIRVPQRGVRCALLQARRPVEDDRDGNHCGVAGWRIDEESLPVSAGNVMRALLAHAAGDTHLKQFRWSAKRRTRTNPHGHELLVQ